VRPLLPAYDLFQPGVFGPGEASLPTDETSPETSPEAVAASPEEGGSLLLPLLLAGGGAFLAYRYIKGKKGAAGAKP
jgi:hypothetical protein